MPPSPSPADVLDALRPIVDPDFGKSIVDLGFVKEIRVDGGDVSFAIELTTPACPVKVTKLFRRLFQKTNLGKRR